MKLIRNVSGSPGRVGILPIEFIYTVDRISLHNGGPSGKCDTNCRYIDGYLKIGENTRIIVEVDGVDSSVTARDGDLCRSYRNKCAGKHLIGNWCPRLRSRIITDPLLAVVPGNRVTDKVIQQRARIGAHQQGLTAGPSRADDGEGHTVADRRIELVEIQLYRNLSNPVSSRDLDRDRRREGSDAVRKQLNRVAGISSVPFGDQALIVFNGYSHIIIQHLR